MIEFLIFGDQSTANSNESTKHFLGIFLLICRLGILWVALSCALLNRDARFIYAFSVYLESKSEMYERKNIHLKHREHLI